MKNNSIKSALLSFALFFSFSFIQAGNGPSGKVVDRQNKEGIANARIVISSMSTGVLADENGVFTLPELNPGQYWIEVSGTGYKQSRIRMNVFENQSVCLDIALQSDEWSMENYTLNEWEFDSNAHILPVVTITPEVNEPVRVVSQTTTEKAGNSLIHAGQSGILSNLIRSLSAK